MTHIMRQRRSNLCTGNAGQIEIELAHWTQLASWHCRTVHPHKVAW